MAGLRIACPPPGSNHRIFSRAGHNREHTIIISFRLIHDTQKVLHSCARRYIPSPLSSASPVTLGGRASSTAGLFAFQLGKEVKSTLLTACLPIVSYHDRVQVERPAFFHQISKERHTDGSLSTRLASFPEGHLSSLQQGQGGL